MVVQVLRVRQQNTVLKQTTTKIITNERAAQRGGQYIGKTDDTDEEKMPTRNGRIDTDKKSELAGCKKSMASTAMLAMRHVRGREK
jgi:hypothetical protein